MKNQIPVGSNQRLGFLEGMRGCAATYVLMHHAVLWLWRPEAGSAYSGMRAMFWGVFRYGYEAVLFFLVLSGFCIHLRYSRQLKAAPREARFDWIPYFLRRARRLYPPLIAALILTFPIDQFGMRQGFAVYSASTPYPELNVFAHPNFEITTLIGNLLFGVNFYAPVWGTNSALWALSYEAWFYLLYPLFYLLSARSIWKATAAMFVLALVSTAVSGRTSFFLPRVLGFMSIWWVGALLADVYTGRIALPLKKATALLAAIAVSGLLLSHTSFAVYAIGCGALFAALISGCLMLNSAHPVLRGFTGFKALGNLSYTLYVIHAPLLIFLSGRAMKQHPGMRLPEAPWVFAAGAALCLAAAYALHWVVERPFRRAVDR